MKKIELFEDFLNNEKLAGLILIVCAVWKNEGLRTTVIPMDFTTSPVDAMNSIDLFI